MCIGPPWTSGALGEPRTWGPSQSHELIQLSLSAIRPPTLYLIFFNCTFIGHIKSTVLFNLYFVIFHFIWSGLFVLDALITNTDVYLYLFSKNHKINSITVGWAKLCLTTSIYMEDKYSDTRQYIISWTRSDRPYVIRGQWRHLYHALSSITFLDYLHFMSVNITLCTCFLTVWSEQKSNMSLLELAIDFSFYIIFHCI